MQRTQFAASLLTAAALLFAGATVNAAPAAGPDHTLAIGVVNMTKVVRSISETRKMETDLRARNQALVQQQQQKEAELQELLKHRDDNVKPQSAQWDDETAVIDKKRAELEVWTALNRTAVERLQKQLLKAIYDHINAASAEVAEAQHLDLVIADQTADIGPDLDRAPLQQLEFAWSSRAVLFSNKKADITEDVLTQIAADYAKQNPAASGPPALPGPGLK
jgi:Skp family chaperone for outer membrane proteins